ncbi:hypothetical protein MTHERMOG20_09310 [Moorella thermoacetica]|uniref:Sporulation membrane protein YtrI C-terminal domain-containing protein n=2 Tax=Neomoorella thermoacetica TaxID=1525 RepID=A0A1J5JXZ1_NEOTH|nr:hypothetical protein [Moorella thermoacetica]AKX94690.1 hypothetical protein MOTHE_c19060 [Moorella thermoacetica]AKX97323.1 hypothetical protein MOTHA_c19860 [Moorella thermoacetica]OIQ09407.1 hypothetical protein MOOR_07830 [Moorella thermoacetica]OIQ57258.1 hypothetical protein MOCA_08390 [Moorella thermoacetica]QDA01151.1 hypothetical protein MothHH_02027 [Moorella thermoacetica]
MRYLAIFILGFLLGASLTNLFLARQQEQLHLARAELEQRLEAAGEELAQLKESLSQRRHQVIVAIEPVITFEGDRPTAVESRAATQAITREVQNILSPLKGQDVQRLNPALIPAMIDGRTIKVNGRQFKLKVTLLLISDKVIVHLQAQGLSSSSSSSATSLMAGCPAMVAI